MNSTNEGLYYGVPLIVIPQSADQPIIARQVANNGAGIKLQMQGLTANQLREAADHVLNTPSFHKAVSNIKESFQNRVDITKLLMRFLNLKVHIISKYKNISAAIIGGFFLVVTAIPF